jgi:hypothetical protein
MVVNAVNAPGAPEADRCIWCRRPLVRTSTVGRRREYCRQSCRQRAYEARQQSVTLGLSENELVVTKQSLETLLDQIYVLQAAVQDVDRDLAVSNEPVDVQRALQWLLSACRPLAETPLL